jgi:hypothetical protein
MAKGTQSGLRGHFTASGSPLAGLFGRSLYRCAEAQDRQAGLGHGDRRLPVGRADAPTGKSPLDGNLPASGLSSTARKNILLFRIFGISYIPACPAPPKGAYHDRRETRGGMWWTLEAPKTRAFFSGRQNRVVLSPRRWCQVCAEARRRRWPTSPEHRGERGISRKPLRGECRVIPV